MNPGYRKNYSILLLIVVICMLNSTSFSQDKVGTSAAPFLGISIGGYEVHALNFLSDHAGYGITTAAAQSDDLNLGWVWDETCFCHLTLLSLLTGLITPDFPAA